MAADTCPCIGSIWMVKLETPKLHALWWSPACHRWSCPVCAETNKQAWADAVREGVRFYMAQGRWYFMTLTMSRKLKSFAYMVKVFHKCWGKFYARIHRLTSQFRYVLIPERGEKNHRFHVHLITSLDLTFKELKKIAVKSGFGWKVDASPLQSPQRAAWYCTKYLTKSLDDNEWPENFRRIRTSHKWPKTANLRDFDAESCWEWVGSRENAKRRLLELNDLMFVNIDIQTGEVLDKVNYNVVEATLTEK